MIEQVSKIINPVRVLKISDWWKIANLTKSDQDSSAAPEMIVLLSRYESLTSKPLTKSMFVCDVEKPRKFDPFFAYGHDKGNPYASNHAEKEDAYQAAQSNLWFEGFEKSFDVAACVDYKNKNCYIQWNEMEHGEWRLYDFKGREIAKNIDTISDLIHHIDFYNRTASKQIEINFSENFIKELLKSNYLPTFEA